MKFYINEQKQFYFSLGDNVCGLTEVVANTVEASREKHLPVIDVQGNNVEVNVGSVEHPMVTEHFIDWVILETNQGYYFKKVTSEKPEAQFALVDSEKVVAAYAYCNLHGLWKTNM